MHARIRYSARVKQNKIFMQFLKFHFPIKHASGNFFYLRNGLLINIEIELDLIHSIETTEKLFDLTGRGHDTDMQSTFYARFLFVLFTDKE